MTAKLNLVLLIVAQVFLTSCQTKKVISEASDSQISAEDICEPPSQYLGNYVTGDQRSYGIGDKKFYETFQYDVVPAKYQWMDGKHEGVSTEYLVFLAKYKTEKEVVEIPVKECPPKELGIACDEETKIAIKEVVKRVVVEPYRIEKCEVPFLYKDGKTRVVTEPSKVIQRVLSY